MTLSPEDLSRARERARAVRRLLRTRRSRRRPTAYQIYLTVVFCAVFGALGGRVVVATVAGGMTVVEVAAFGPAVLMVALLAAARFGVWQGPVSFRAADVALVLTAPLAVEALVRPKLDQALAVGAGVGILVAGFVLLIVSGAGVHLGAVRAVAWVASLVAFTALATAASWLVQSSRRLAVLVRSVTPLAVALAGALLGAGLAGSAGRLAGVWSGPWGWTIAPLTATPGWPVATIALLGLAGATTVVARRRAGAASRESFLARAQTRSGLVASTVMLDYRSASVTVRTALPASHRERRRAARRPRQARWAILWRDALALDRDRARVAWATALMAAGVWELVTHPGQQLPAVLGAVAIYFAAARVSEPLRIDVDLPARSRLVFGWTFARVLVAHCLLPTLLLLGIGAATITGLVIAGAVSPAALALAPTLLVTIVGVAVLTVSLAARRKGRIDPSWLIVDPSNPLGWALLAILLAPWLLIEVAVIGETALLVGHAALHGRALLATGIGAFALTAAIASALLAAARRSRPPE